MLAAVMMNSASLCPFDSGQAEHLCLAQVRGAIIENTFSSIQDVAPSVMPLLRPFIGPRRCAHPRNRGASQHCRRSAELHDLMSFIRTVIMQHRPLNFLIRNRWESIKQIKKAAKVPMLLLSSLKACYLSDLSDVDGCVDSFTTLAELWYGILQQPVASHRSACRCRMRCCLRPR